MFFLTRRLDYKERSSPWLGPWSNWWKT